MNLKILDRKHDVMKHLDLCIGFFRSGMLGFGGGPSSIPLVRLEAVDRYKWISEDDFDDMLAIANTLPGPINTKMAAYIGYRVAGILGIFTAILASILPTIILMIIFLTFLESFQEYSWVKGMTNAVVPVVGVMMATLTWDFFKKSQQGLGWLKSIVLCVISFILIFFINIHPAIIIAAILVYVLALPVRKVKEEVQRRSGS